MKSYEFARLINGLFEQIVRFNEVFANNEGIYFRCKIESECLGYERNNDIRHLAWEGRVAKDFHIILLKPHKVFTCITQSVGPISTIPPVELWTNDSNHDSCWRDVARRHLTDITVYCHDKAFKNCPEEFRPETMSQEVRYSLETSFLGNIFKLVQVEYKSIPEDCYHYQLTDIREIKKNIEIG